MGGAKGVHVPRPPPIHNVKPNFTQMWLFFTLCNTFISSRFNTFYSEGCKRKVQKRLTSGWGMGNGNFARRRDFVT